MSWKKKIAWSILVILAGLQFVRPDKNEGMLYSENDITHSVTVPENIKNILERSCNDCHSNKTNYPWYSNIQPLGWWLADHVKEGKGELNISEFNTYKVRRKLRKFTEIQKQVEEGEMPMESYTWLHSNAKLSDSDKKILIEWAEKCHSELDTNNAAGK